MESRIQQVAQVVAVALLVIGCFIVIRPFFTAVLFAAVICTATWPLFKWLCAKLRGHRTTTALLMTLMLLAVIVVPFALLAATLVDNVTALMDMLRASFEEGPPEPPAWLIGLPLVGQQLNEYWHTLMASREELLELAKRLLEPGRRFVLATAAIIGEGVAQMTLAMFIGFFFYRDGEALVRAIRAALDKVGGALGTGVIATVSNTVIGVTYGLIGTALAQAALAAIGFFIAGVPGAMLLGAVTFILSLVPVGPPLVWGPAAAWLIYQDQLGWGIFLAVYGFFIISGIDNILKPLLISRGSALPFVLVFLGVLGGVIGFGFIGIFIGPTLLAVGYSLARQWTGLTGKVISTADSSAHASGSDKS